MTFRRALVTGSTGFLGKWLCRELRASGFSVIEHSRRPTFGQVAIDLESPSEVRRFLTEERPEVVFHLAGSTAPLGFAALLQVNAGLTAVLLDALDGDLLKSTKVVLVGSAAEYGQANPEDGPVTETRRAAPLSAYGLSKLAQTELGLAAVRLGRRVTIARPSNILGPGAHRNQAIGRFVEQLVQTKATEGRGVLRTGNLGAVRDYVDVRDVARALVDLSCSSTAEGKIFNLSSGVGHSMKEVVRGMIAAFEIDTTIEEDQSQPSGIPWFVADPSMLASTIEFRPRDLTESLEFLARTALEDFAHGS